MHLLLDKGANPNPALNLNNIIENLKSMVILKKLKDNDVFYSIFSKAKTLPGYNEDKCREVVDNLLFKEGMQDYETSQVGNSLEASLSKLKGGKRRKTSKKKSNKKKKRKSVKRR